MASVTRAIATSSPGYRRALGLRRRLVIPVPVLTPRLSSYWIQLITPLSNTIARPLAEGLKNPVVCPHPRTGKRRGWEGAADYCYILQKNRP